MPSFKRYLYWYVTLQCTGCTVIVVASFGYAFCMAYFRIATAAEIEEQMTAWEPPMRGLAIILTIVVCIAVASHHGLKFGKGFGGYILGNVLATLLVLPLTIGINAAAVAYGFPWGAIIDLALLIGYSVACIIAIVAGRRYSTRRRLQASIAEVFQ